MFYNKITIDTGNRPVLYWFWKNSERTDLKIEQPDGMTNHTIALKKDRTTMR